MVLGKIGILDKDWNESIFPVEIGILDKDWYSLIEAVFPFLKACVCVPVKVILSTNHIPVKVMKTTSQK